MTGGGYATGNNLGSKFTLAGNTLTASGAVDPNYVNRFKVSLNVSGLSATDFLTLASCDILIGQTGTNSIVWSHLSPVTNFPINATISGVTGYPVDASFSERPAYWNTTPGTTNVFTRNGSFFAASSAKDGGSYLLPYNSTYHTMGDLGDPNDLKGLRSEVAYDSEVMSGRPAVDNTLVWGYVYLKWDGTTTDITVRTGPSTGTAWATSELGDQSASTATQIGQTLTLQMPEPATMALLVMGGLSMLARRRRA